jgi:hypothetical protein
MCPDTAQGNLKQVMRGILLPNSDMIFGLAARSAYLRKCL